MQASFRHNVKSWWRSQSNLFDRFAGTKGLTDSDLLIKYVEDARPEYMEVLIERHGDAFYHFLLTLADAMMAEDVSQQTWLKVIENPSAFQTKLAQFRSWLFTVGRNGIIDELRRINRWVWQSIEEDENTDSSSSLDSTLNLDNDETDNEPLWITEREGLQEAFNLALTNLPFPQKEAIMLQLEGFSLEEISHVTGEPFETIKSRLRFARKSLKETLEVAA